MKKAPQRIQLKRTKGFNFQQTSLDLNGLPAVRVTRPGPWGNPYKIGDRLKTLAGEMILDREWCLFHFRSHALNSIGRQKIVAELKNKNVACFCRLDEECHGDYLLKIANEK